MLKIDNTLLVEIGLGTLPEAEKNSFLKHVYETLEMRVGIRLADQMSNEQLDEFERYFEAKDDAGAFTWLETNFPNYKEIVQEEFDKLKAEVAQSAPQILAASQASAAQAVPQQMEQPQVAAAQPQQYQPTPVPQYAAPPQPQQYEEPQPQYAPPQPAAMPLPQQSQPQQYQPSQPAPQQYQPPFPNQQPPAGPTQ